MPRYVIERELPAAGTLTTSQLKAISQPYVASQGIGSQVEWIENYVTHDRIYCIYNAPNADLLCDHARRGWFPANRVSELISVIDSNTAEFPANEAEHLPKDWSLISRRP
jgi:hypothetical protein